MDAFDVNTIFSDGNFLVILFCVIMKYYWIAIHQDSLSSHYLKKDLEITFKTSENNF